MSIDQSNSRESIDRLIDQMSLASQRPRTPYNQRRKDLVVLFEVFNAIDDVEKNGWQKLHHLIKQNPSILIMQDSRGYTPLLHVVATKNRAALRALLISPNILSSFLIKDKHGSAPLHLAAGMRDDGATILNSLINAEGLSRAFWQRDRSGDTPLHIAIKNDNVDAFYYLLLDSLICWTKRSFLIKNNAGRMPYELLLSKIILRQRAGAADVKDRLTTSHLETLEEEYRKVGLQYLCAQAKAKHGIRCPVCQRAYCTHCGR